MVNYSSKNKLAFNGFKEDQINYYQDSAQSILNSLKTAEISNDPVKLKLPFQFNLSHAIDYQLTSDLFKRGRITLLYSRDFEKQPYFAKEFISLALHQEILSRINCGFIYSVKRHYQRSFDTSFNVHINDHFSAGILLGSWTALINKNKFSPLTAGFFIFGTID